jgi:hypothetical protein
MNTVGPAISLRTSCWFLPQNEQWSEFFESPLATLLILASRQSDRLGVRTFIAHAPAQEFRFRPMRFF